VVCLKKSFALVGCCVWNDYKIPKGYISVGAFLLNPTKEEVFFVCLPEVWIKKNDVYTIARAVGDLIRRELVNTAKT
jgi:hypothetical protein